MKVLAQVEYTDPSGSSRRWSRLKPLYRAEGGLWIPIKDDEARRMEFPPAGLVFWWDSPSEAERVGTLWLLELEEDPRIKDPGKDKLRVSQGDRSDQFEILPVYESVELRRLAAREEIVLREPPVGRVFIRLHGESDRWVGPMKFVEDPEEQNYRGPTNVHTGFLELFEIADGDLQELSMSLEGERTVRVLTPDRSLEDHARGYWAAQDDRHLLHGLIKRFRHLNEAARKGMDLTDRAVRTYLDTFDELNLIGEDAKRERARNEAVRQLLEEVELDRSALRRAEEALLAHPEIRERIDDIVNERRRKRLDELESEIENLAKERREEIHELDEILASRRSELEEAEAALARLESDARERLREIARKVVEDPVSRLADNLVVNAIVDAIRPREKGPASRMPVEMEPEGADPKRLVDLTAAAEVGARHLGLRPAGVLAALATVLDGRPMLAFGMEARALCRLVGSLTSAGLVWELSVPTGIFGSDDLLDLPAARASGTSASILRLGEIFEIAVDSEHTHTVVLQGVNRAPLEVAFEELLPDLPRGPDTASASVVWRKDDEFRLVKPASNVILTGTLSFGPSCFRVAAHLATKVGLVDADRGLSPGDPSLPIPRFSLATPVRTSLLQEALAAGEALGQDTSVAEEQEGEELKVWAGVFDDPHTGALEWLMTRASNRVVDATFREGLNSDIVESLGEVPQAEAIERLRKRLEQDHP